MPAVLAQSQALGAEKLRWGKYSAAYRGCLLEGIRCFERYLAEAGVGLDALSKQKPRVVDEVLEKFVKTMHEKGNKSSLTIAKLAVLTMQVYRPRLRKATRYMGSNQSVGRDETFALSRSSPFGFVSSPGLQGPVAFRRGQSEIRSQALEGLWDSVAGRFLWATQARGTDESQDRRCSASQFSIASK